MRRGKEDDEKKTYSELFSSRAVYKGFLYVYVCYLHSVGCESSRKRAHKGIA